MKQGKEGWLEIDPGTDMSEVTRERYEAYKAAYRHAQDMKREYERSMEATLKDIGALENSQGLVFGYNFGKASIKVVAKNEIKAKAETKPRISLVEYLAQQQ